MAKITLDKNGQAKVAGTLMVYNFDGLTGEFTGAGDEYLPQGVGLPANACIIAPPHVDAGSVAVFCDGGWQMIADHRGETVYSTADGTAQAINAPGDYPAGTTTLAPATAFDKWDGEKWVTDETAQQDAFTKSMEVERAVRISEANSMTQLWQTQLLLGIITEIDRATLTTYMKYIQDLQKVDTCKNDLINWPPRPY